MLRRFWVWLQRLFYRPKHVVGVDPASGPDMSAVVTWRQEFDGTYTLTDLEFKREREHRFPAGRPVADVQKSDGRTS